MKLQLSKRNPLILSVTNNFANCKQQCRQQKTAASMQTQNTQNTQNAQIPWEKARPFEEVPRPGLFESVRNYLPGGKYYKMDMSKILPLFQEEHGDIIYIPGLFGKPAVIVTYNSDDFETVFRNEGIWPNRMGAETLSYHRLKHQADFFKGVEGLITSQGEAWGNFRSKVNPVMLQPKNVRLYVKKMSQVNKDFVELIKKLRDSKTNEMPKNFEDYINRWTLESVSVVALDKQMGLLKEKTVEPQIQKLFNCITDFMTYSAELDNKPSIWKIIPTAGFKRIMRAYDGILEVTSQYVNEAIQRLEEAQKTGKEKPENEKSVLEKLLKIDRKIAIVMAMDMLMAGVDTTTSTFTGLMLCLAKNPEKQAKLRQEILRILPEKDADFNEKSLNEIPYLRACIKESLRLYPLVFGNGRAVQRDVVLSGYQIPKGTMIGMIITGIHRNEKYFQQPNEFLPERWLRVPKDGSTEACPALRPSNSFTYLPFGFGPRSCIGRRIAEMELELGIARIVRNFEIAFNYPTENAFKSLLINVPNIPLKFQLTDLKE